MRWDKAIMMIISLTSNIQKLLVLKEHHATRSPHPLLWISSAIVKRMRTIKKFFVLSKVYYWGHVKSLLLTIDDTRSLPGKNIWAAQQKGDRSSSKSKKEKEININTFHGLPLIWPTDHLCLLDLLNFWRVGPTFHVRGSPPFSL